MNDHLLVAISVVVVDGVVVCRGWVEEAINRLQIGLSLSRQILKHLIPGQA